ncbi:MAG: ABC transporter substrate-binding protein [Treponema sp.]|nr:ABC transporter substrate-binding protein [Treponema sp.]
MKYYRGMTESKNRVLPKAALLLAAFLPAFFGCSGERAASGMPGELRYAFFTEPDTLDPLAPSSSADGRSIMFNVFEGLVRPDTEGRHPVALAESYRMLEGGLVHEFTLRSGVLFHDGSPLTREDVRFSLETAAEAGLDGLRAVESIEFVGERDLRINLSVPDPDFLPFLTVGIVKAGSTDRQTRAVGTGPFFVESYTVQQSLVLRRFPDYWREDVPRLEKVTIVFFDDQYAAFLALRSGSIDGAFFTEAIARQADPARFDVVPFHTAMVQKFVLNNAAPPFDDLRVRRAFNYGIDRQEIIDLAFFGRGSPVGSPVIPGLSLYYEESLEAAYPHDPELARSLLAEAGFGEGGRELSIEITVPSNYTMHVDTAQVIVSQLERIGVKATIRLVDWATWLSRINRDRDFQTTVISVDGRTASPRSFLARYRSDSGSNFTNFSAPEFDRAFDLAVSAQDEESRILYYGLAQRAVVENAASVYLQDILAFRVFRRGAFAGILEYPLSVTDFASMYAR